MDDSLDSMSETSLELFPGEPVLAEPFVRQVDTGSVTHETPEHFHKSTGRWIDGVILRMRSVLGFHPTTAVNATLSRRLRNLSRRGQDAPSDIALYISYTPCRRRVEPPPCAGRGGLYAHIAAAFRYRR